jgi:hypothetical protein
MLVKSCSREVYNILNLHRSKDYLEGVENLSYRDFLFYLDYPFSNDEDSISASFIFRRLGFKDFFTFYIVKKL